MEYFALFNLLILTLFFLSKFLIKEIYSFFYKITRSENFSTNALAFIFFPGVVVHEMSHYLAAVFLLVKTGRISLLPKREGDYVKLGSVSVAKSNIVKEFIIGASPLFIGITIILVIIYFVLQDLSGLNILKMIVSLYGIFILSNTMYASRKDFQAALPFLVSIITVGIVLVILGVRFPFISLEYFPQIDLSRIFHMGSLYLGVPVIIDLTVILALRIFNRMW